MLKSNWISVSNILFNIFKTLEYILNMITWLVALYNSVYSRTSYEFEHLCVCSKNNSKLWLPLLGNADTRVPRNWSQGCYRNGLNFWHPSKFGPNICTPWLSRPIAISEKHTFAGKGPSCWPIFASQAARRWCYSVSQWLRVSPGFTECGYQLKTLMMWLWQVRILMTTMTMTKTMLAIKKLSGISYYTLWGPLQIRQKGEPIKSYLDIKNDFLKII